MDRLRRPAGGVFEHFCGLVGGGRHGDAFVVGGDPHELTHLMVSGHDHIDDVAHPVGLADACRTGQDEALGVRVEEETEECLSGLLLSLVQIIFGIVHGYPFPV